VCVCVYIYIYTYIYIYIYSYYNALKRQDETLLGRLFIETSLGP
jgi:hypothetical protein